MGDIFKQKFKRKDGRTGESRKWYGEFTDEHGKRRRVPLSIDKEAARAILRKHIKSVERRRAGLEDEFTESANSPLKGLLAGFLDHLKLKGRRPRYREEVEQIVTIILEACRFRTLADLKAGPLDSYLAAMTNPKDRGKDNPRPASARTRAKHRQAIVGFANFLVKKGKLEANPLERSTKPEGDESRRRRALSVDELKRLIVAAKDRPLKEGLLIRWGPRAGKLERRLPRDEIARLEWTGRNNVLLYRTAYYTGFRADELRSLWAGDLIGSRDNPTLFLPQDRTKNKKDALCPIPALLASDLRAWIEQNALGEGDPIFKVPRDTAALIRKDLAEAGIAYEDARGRVADFHALRGSLSSHMNAAGVAPTVAKAIMRHSTIKLTLDRYHDEAMNDERGAIDRLPEV
jgi:integrase